MLLKYIKYRIENALLPSHSDILRIRKDLKHYILFSLIFCEHILENEHVQLLETAVTFNKAILDGPIQFAFLMN